MHNFTSFFCLQCQIFGKNEILEKRKKKKQTKMVNKSIYCFNTTYTMVCILI